MNTIKEHWESFAAAVIPNDASPYQIQDMRRAFYGGAMSAYNLCADIGLSSVSEEEGMAILENLEEEIRIFRLEVKHGFA